MELFLHRSPVAYWAPTDWGVHLSGSYLFAFSSCSWGSQGKNTEVVFHSLLQWTTFCQTPPPRPDRLGWPHTACLSFIELDKGIQQIQSFSRVRLLATPWTVAHQAPLSMEFSKQEYWSGWSFPSPGDLPDPGIKPGSPALQADSSPSEPPGKP